MRLPLLGGAYATRSIIAECQRSINLFPETNPKSALVPVTHYQRPGFLPLVQGPVAPVRCIYRASNGNGYCVIGQNVYSVSPAFALTLLGQLTLLGVTPCSMIDNGIQILLVDNTRFGYIITLATNAFQQIDDPTGTFTGATRVDYIDTFILWNVLGTNLMGSTNSNTILPFNPLYVAGKTDYPDPLVVPVVNRHEILLMGQLKSEIWYDAGNPLFPFAELPGAYIEHGVVAPFSLASSDISVFWLGQNLQGQGLVFRQRGYETKLISNYAIAVAIRKMAKTGSIADAIGYTYQQDGHIFYVLSFPTGDQTWIFDDSIGTPDEAWHQRAWSDQDGTLHRDRSNCCANLYGKIVVGDWENGTLYSLDLDTYTDTVNGVAGPIQFIRTMSRIGTGRVSRKTGQPVLADGKMVMFDQFAADVESGNVPQQDQAPAIFLRYSDDRGRTFSNYVQATLGGQGDYLNQPLWRGPLGQARDRIFELSYTANGPAALNGAWCEATVLEK